MAARDVSENPMIGDLNVPDSSHFNKLQVSNKHGSNSPVQGRGGRGIACNCFFFFILVTTSIFIVGCSFFITIKLVISENFQPADVCLQNVSV